METMTLLQWMFDILLGVGLLWLAWQVLACPHLFKAIVLFVAFGLLMTLVWVRLEAPDVALSEAAIGAGLTGALLLAALGKMGTTEDGSEEVENQGKVKTLFSKWVPVAALLLAVSGLGYAILSLPSYAPGLIVEITANLENSGVSNPVTAVLLNFRGYDTLLEMVVLLLALLGIWSLGDGAVQRESAPDPVLDILSRLLSPLLILVAAYLLWVGGHAPGGAFQAGSILGAAGVLLLLAGWRLRTNLTTLPLRLMLVAGPGAFVAMAAFTMLIGGRLMEYPPEYAGSLILSLEAVATLSIGVTLAALFLGRRPQGREAK